jgi:tetratricopeptide (TPR) repeat protein
MQKNEPVTVRGKITNLLDESWLEVNYKDKDKGKDWVGWVSAGYVKKGSPPKDPPPPPPPPPPPTEPPGGGNSQKNPTPQQKPPVQPGGNSQKNPMPQQKPPVQPGCKNAVADLVNKGDGYFGKGDYTNAAKSYEAALKLSPGNAAASTGLANAKRELAEIQQKKDAEKKAREDAEAARQKEAEEKRASEKAEAARKKDEAAQQRADDERKKQQDALFNAVINLGLDAILKKR